MKSQKRILFIGLIIIGAFCPTLRGSDQSYTKPLIELNDSERLAAINERFVKARTKFQIELLFKEVEELLTLGDDLTPKVQAKGAQLLLLREFRSLGHRLAPLFERSQITRSKFLSQTQKFLWRLKQWMPEEHGGAIGDYLLEPFTKSTVVFRKFSELQEVIRQVWSPRIQETISKLEGLSIPGSGAQVAGLYRFLSELHLFCAYNLEDFARVLEDQQAANTLSDKVKALRKYPQFLTLISQEDLGLSVEALQKSDGSVTASLKNLYEQSAKDWKDWLPKEFDEKKWKRVYFADRSYLEVLNPRWGMPEPWTKNTLEAQQALDWIGQFDLWEHVPSTLLPTN